MSSIVEVPVKKLFVGKVNVRRNIGDISELVDSIRQVGILEPLIVRPAPEDTYEVIVGNRRYNAAKLVGLKKVPCVIKEMDDAKGIIASLTENIQRGDVTEEEIIEAYTALHNLDPKRWTQTAFAKNVGKSQSWIANLLVAYQSLIKLRTTGIVSGMKAHPRERERKAGIAPVKHLMDIEFAMRSEDVKKALPEEELEKKRRELASVVLGLPQEDAKRVIDRFKMYPEKPMEETKEQALAKKTGVALETYLPPRIARELDRIAEEKAMSIEDILPDVVEKGIQAEGKVERAEREIPAKMVNEYDVGDVKCPECGTLLRLIHIEPGNKHKVEEKPG